MPTVVKVTVRLCNNKIIATLHTNFLLMMPSQILVELQVSCACITYLIFLITWELSQLFYVDEQKSIMYHLLSELFTSISPSNNTIQ